MKNKTLEDTISSLMVWYADYRSACHECVDLNDRYGTEEYEAAVERRTHCAKYIREDIDALKSLGIKFDRFDYIGQ